MHQMIILDKSKSFVIDDYVIIPFSVCKVHKIRPKLSGSAFIKSHIR
jgi:hypothetical protein